MKKIYRFTLVFVFTSSIALSQNTFPPSGYVGIGTTSPNRILDVVGRLNFRANNAETAGVFLTGSDGNQSAFFGQTDFSGVSPVGIYHSGTWRFIVNNSGYVGIGTIIPQQKLDVVGRLKFRAEYSNTAGFWLTGNDGVQTAFIGQLDVTGTSPVGIYHGGDWRLLVNNAGNVAIGTTNPGSYKLAVAGKIAATGEVRVFTAGTTIFPDYVFDPSYQLPSLEETEKYVKENRHLPEVPSAKEMERDGISLNEMNITLLKKVEELTLYMIEMKKENDAMKTRLEILEKKNK